CHRECDYLHLVEFPSNSRKVLTLKLRKAWLRIVKEKRGRVGLCGDRDLAAEIASFENSRSVAPVVQSSMRRSQTTMQEM
ncbi:hypothetical protein N7537_005339, partial [Penicillium hordei]